MTKKNSLQVRWAEIDDSLSRSAPHLSSFFVDSDAFREIRVKMNDDGTFLAIAKGYGSDGGERICFGVGYTVSSSLLAIDGTMQAGRWRLDKPWADRNGTKGR